VVKERRERRRGRLNFEMCTWLRLNLGTSIKEDMHLKKVLAEIGKYKGRGPKEREGGYSGTDQGIWQHKYGTERKNAGHGLEKKGGYEMFQTVE